MRLNFSINHFIPEDGMWGDMDESGTWNGLVKLLIQNDVSPMLLKVSVHTYIRNISAG